MKRLETAAFVIVCSWLPATLCLAQPSDTDPFQEYRQFLNGHRDMTPAELLAMYPAGDFQEQVGRPWESVQYHELIDASCRVTADEQRLLEKNGFVVTERLRQRSVVDQLLYIWRNDLPLFISTDAILHALGRSYDRIIRDVELGLLIDRLSALLTGMHERLAELDARYAAQPQMRPMLRDVDLYLTVARTLLGHDVAPRYVENVSEVDQLLTLIQRETLDTYPLFAPGCREIDFSQFTPRGHYTQHEDLKKYFRAMMWLGRTEMYLSAPKNAVPMICPLPSPEDIQRQTIDAVLVLELVNAADATPLYDEIERVLTFMFGEQDNLTVANLKTVVASLGVEDASELLDPIVLGTFQDRLAAGGLGSQRILSQMMWSPMTPEAVQPPSAFMLFGQRFVIDSYITGNVIADKIVYQGETICRLFPSTLDVLGGLGNNAAMELLVPELDTYLYASNLAAVRYLVDAHDATFWDSSIYNMWLNVIRALSPPANREALPAFMQTAAWWHEKMNTQLASWTELRHNSILYAKQSYTPGFICSYPGAYVEPFPEFYRRLRALADASRLQFKDVVGSEPLPWNDPPFFDVPVPFPDVGIPGPPPGQDIPSPDVPLEPGIAGYFERFSSIMETLETIARKELDGTSLTEEEILFMKEMLYARQVVDLVCYTWYDLDGWYDDLLYGEDAVLSGDAPPSARECVVADYHTVPTDCGGNMTGWVLHAGTGPVDLAIITAEAPEGETAAFVGPVMSYYEYTTTGFQRLTDEEWETAYLPLATRPAWTASYVVNEAGGVGEGSPTRR